jgi:hypothetical protein
MDKRREKDRTRIASLFASRTRFKILKAHNLMSTDASVLNLKREQGDDDDVS